MSATTTPATATDPDRGPAAAAIGVVAALLHLGVGIFPLSASGLVAPAWAIGVVGLGWLVAAVALRAIWRRRPALALLVPPTTVAAWWAFITLGEQVLGWTA